MFSLLLLPPFFLLLLAVDWGGGTKAGWREQAEAPTFYFVCIKPPSVQLIDQFIPAMQNTDALLFSSCSPADIFQDLNKLVIY